MLQGEKHFGRCCNFDFDLASSSSRFKAPPNYPSIKHTLSPPFPSIRDIVKHKLSQSVGPVSLFYPYLVMGMRAACYKLHSKQWKVSETRLYLKLLGVSTSLTVSLIHYTTNQISTTVSTEDVCDQLPLPQLRSSSILLSIIYAIQQHPMCSWGIFLSIASQRPSKFFKLW